MPTEKTLAKRASLAETATQIDEVANAVQLYAGNDGGLAHQLAVAQAVVDMRALLTDEVMQPVLALMNTGLGFKTDQDPRRPSRNNPSPKAYTTDVVREVVIEAKLRGFNLVGQEFNIIAGGFYACKAGLQRKLKDGKLKGLSKVRDFYDLPKMSNDGQSATVKCYATWEFNAKPDRADFEFFIKLHGMGADAALGKAERRLAKEVLKFVTGESTPDGEVEEDAKPAQIEDGPRLRRLRKDPTPSDDQIPGAEVPPVAGSVPPPVVPVEASVMPPPAAAAVAPLNTVTGFTPPPMAAGIDPSPRNGNTDPTGAGLMNSVRGAGIAPVDALCVIRRMFPEQSKDCLTVQEVGANHPNVRNAVSRAWATFVKLCGEAKSQREREEAAASAAPVDAGEPKFGY